MNNSTPNIIIGKRKGQFSTYLCLYSLVMFIVVLTCIYYIHHNMYGNKSFETTIKATPSGVLGQIVNTQKLRQEFSWDSRGMRSVAFMWGTYCRTNNANVNVRLTIDGKFIREWNFNASTLIDNNFYVLTLPDLGHFTTPKQLFVFDIKVVAEDPQSNLTLYLSHGSNDGMLYSNNRLIKDKSLCISRSFTNKYGVNSMALLCISIFGAGLFILSLYLLFYRNVKYSKIILYILFVFGFVYSIVIPATRVPDEPAHFFRAYEISQGHITSEIRGTNVIGRELPTALINNITTNSAQTSLLDIIDSDIYIQKKDIKFASFPNTALYSPLSYLSQSVGIFIGGLFWQNIWFIWCFARLFTCLSVLCILFFAFKYASVDISLLYSIVLLPMFLHEMISLAPDATITALIIFLVSFVSFLRYEQKTVLRMRQKILIFGLVILIASSKIVYMPALLILFLIPKERFRSCTDHFLCVGISAALIAIFGLGWLMIAQSYLHHISHMGSNPQFQPTYILSFPFTYVKTLLRTVITHSAFYKASFIGASLGWLNIDVPFAYLLLPLILINLTRVYTLVYNRPQSSIRNDFVYNIVCAVITSVTCLLIFTSLYIQWTPLYAGIIDGVQGRYFIPILLPAFLTFMPGLFHKYEIKPSRYLLLAFACVDYVIAVQLLYHCIA